MKWFEGFKRRSEYNEFLNGEKEIKKELDKPGGLEKGYKIYYLLDNSWAENYKDLSNNSKYQEINDILKVSLITTKIEKKDFTYIHKSFNCSLPYNFTLVTQKFIDLIYKNFTEEEKKQIKISSFKVIIGGKCLIMRDTENESSSFAFITLYNEKKQKFNNSIDYFLKIDDLDELDKDLNYILMNNIWNYFEEINYCYKDEYKRVINFEGKVIKYIVLNNGNIKQIEDIYNFIEENIQKSNFKMNELSINKFYSFLLSLYNLEEFYNILKEYYNDEDKQIFKIVIDFILNKKFDEKIEEYFSTSIKSDDYKIIINDIFEKINSELTNENEDDLVIKQNKLVDQFDEIKAKNIFYESNKNASIIKQFFLITMEKIILCKTCKKRIYNFYYSNFFIIDLNNEENEVLLKNKIFKSQDTQIKQKCNYFFCAGKMTDSIKNEKIYDYPEILIVLIDGKKFKNFKLENNNFIYCNNDQDILYYLTSFIESDTNIVYINESSRWFKFIGIDNKIESLDYNKRHPVVFFYKLTDKKYIKEIKKYQTQIVGQNMNINHRNINNNIVNNFNFNLNDNNNMNNFNNMAFNNNLNNMFNMNNNNIKTIFNQKNMNINHRNINNNIVNNFNLIGNNNMNNFKINNYLKL